MINMRLTGILATFVAALIALVAGAALYTSVRFADAERGARLAVQDAVTYSRALDQLKDAVLDAETGQRGYLLTGDRDYLQPYTRASSLITSGQRNSWALEALRQGADEELRQLLDFKMQELAETIRLFDTGNPGAALTMIQTDRGREVMSDIRAAIRLRQAEAQSRADAATARSQIYSDRSGLVSSLLSALLVLAALMGAVTVYLWSRTDRAVTEAEEATDIAERAEVIAQELNHRMKNMFAVAQGMLRQSARKRGEAVEHFAAEAAARLTAMSHAYSVAPDLETERMLNTDDVIDKVVRAQLLDGHGFSSEGQGHALGKDAVTPLALILHEWTTNAIKYGAWTYDMDETKGKPARPDGSTRVVITTGKTEDGRLELLWDEQYARGGQVEPTANGYGTKLIKACAMQLGGNVTYDWHEGGVRIRLTANPDRL